MTINVLSRPEYYRGWDHLDRERNKGQSTEEIWEVLKEPSIIYQNITKENFKTVSQE